MACQKPSDQESLGISDDRCQLILDNQHVEAEIISVGYFLKGTVDNRIVDHDATVFTVNY